MPGNDSLAKRYSDLRDQLELDVSQLPPLMKEKGVNLLKLAAASDKLYGIAVLEVLEQLLALYLGDDQVRLDQNQSQARKIEIMDALLDPVSPEVANGMLRILGREECSPKYLCESLRVVSRALRERELRVQGKKSGCYASDLFAARIVCLFGDDPAAFDPKPLRSWGIALAISLLAATVAGLRFGHFFEFLELLSVLVSAAYASLTYSEIWSGVAHSTALQGRAAEARVPISYLGSIALLVLVAIGSLLVDVSQSAKNPSSAPFFIHMSAAFLILVCFARVDYLLSSAHRSHRLTRDYMVAFLFVDLPLATAQAALLLIACIAVYSNFGDFSELRNLLCGAVSFQMFASATAFAVLASRLYDRLAVPAMNNVEF